MTLASLLVLNRALAATVVFTLGVLFVGPFQGLEQQLGIPDTVGHAMAFYTLSLVTFVTMPDWRRNDLALGVFAFGALIECAQAATGRTASLTDLLANGAGIGLAMVPQMTERLRQMTRAHPQARLGQLGRLERRRSGRTGSAAHASPQALRRGSAPDHLVGAKEN